MYIVQIESILKDGLKSLNAPWFLGFV